MAKEKKFLEDYNRPWGGFTVFAHNEQCTVKIISVKAGEILSIQSHTKRSEIWQCITGIATVYRGPIKPTLEEIKANLKTTPFKPGDNVVIPVETVHTIEAQEDTQFIEIATGEFDEDDIIRYEDKYGRTSPKKQN